MCAENVWRIALGGDCSGGGGEFGGASAAMTAAAGATMRRRGRQSGLAYLRMCVVLFLLMCCVDIEPVSLFLCHNLRAIAPCRAR